MKVFIVLEDFGSYDGGAHIVGVFADQATAEEIGKGRMNSIAEIRIEEWDGTKQVQDISLGYK